MDKIQRIEVIANFLRGFFVQHNLARARIHQKPNRHAIDLAVHIKMPVRVFVKHQPLITRHTRGRKKLAHQHIFIAIDNHQPGQQQHPDQKLLHAFAKILPRHIRHPTANRGQQNQQIYQAGGVVHNAYPSFVCGASTQP